MTNAYAVAYFAAATLSLAAGLFAWRRRRAAGARWLALTMLSSFVWALSLGLEASTASFSLQVIFAKMNYLGSSSVGVFFLLFAVEFSERSKWLTPRRIGALLVLPIVAVTLAATNEIHHLIWTRITPPPPGGMIQIYYHGPAYWAIAAFVLGMTLMASGLLADYAIRSRGVLRWQSVEIITAAAIPVVAYVFNVTQGAGQMVLDSAAWISVTGSILSFSILRQHLLGIAPIARGVLFDELPEGVLVLDSAGRVVDVNRAFEQLAMSPVSVGVQADRALSAWPDARDRVSERDAMSCGRELTSPTGLTVSVECIPLGSSSGQRDSVGGWLIVARDVTAYHLAQNQIREMNEHLEQQVAARTRSLREALERVRSMSSDILLAEDRERRHLAEELHDRVSQSLSVAHLRLSAEIGRGDFSAAGLEAVDELLLQAMRETRAITTEIAPTILYELGLLAALENLAEGAEATHGLRVVVAGDDSLELADDVSAVLLRSARELLMNVVKHAGTDCAWIALSRTPDGGVALEVTDKGVGVPEGTFIGSANSFGLLSVRERITHFGGSLDVRPGDTCGTVATITLPLQSANEGARP